MLERLRTQIGTAGLVVAIVALVAALGGGAYAATGGNGGKATASAKAKQGKQGKPGKTGPAGPAGPAGAKGDTGAAGSNGSNGSPGANGTSVTTTHLEPGEGPAGEECEEGGTEFTAASGTEVVCNGEEGAPGDEGPPGPTCNPSGECLLPEGATETGSWFFQAKQEFSYVLNISYPLRLASAPEFILVPEASSETPGAVTGCPGTVENPEADPGKFCLYSSFEANMEEGNPPHELESTPDPTSGMYVTFPLGNFELPEAAHGTWAVTSP
jgi:hypothetical protein